VPDLATIWPGILYFGMLVAAGIGAPIPEELPIVLAGVWIGNHPEFGVAGWLMLPICIVGAVTCDAMLYGLGRWFGPRLLNNRLMQRLLPPERLEHIERNFHNHGIKILLFTRMLPGIRSPIFITAGIMRLPLPRFLLGDLLYAIPGISLLFALAWWFGTKFQELVEKFEHEVDRFKPLIIVIILLAIGTYLVIHFLRHPVSTGDPKEVPLGDKVASGLATVEKTLHLSHSDLRLPENQEAEVSEQPTENQAAAEKVPKQPSPSSEP
jgi:membrane protein DedA with SNARE-associated domain